MCRMVHVVPGWTQLMNETNCLPVVAVKYFVRTLQHCLQELHLVPHVRHKEW